MWFLRPLKYSELCVFDFFVRAGCGNGRDLSLIRSLNQLDQSAFDPSSADSIRQRLFEIGGLSANQRFCFAKESLTQDFKILSRKNDLVQMFPQNAREEISLKIRHLWSESEIIGQVLAGATNISFAQILRKALKLCAQVFSEFRYKLQI